MKAFILIAILALTAAAAKAQTLTRPMAEQMLIQRQINLQTLERGGAQLLLGEVTGGGRVAADRVQVILLQDRAVLKREIVSMDFSPVTGKLSDLDSFRVGGEYFTKEDIRGVVIK